jgi:hypothetical protein
MPILIILRINRSSRFLNLTLRRHFREQILNISSGFVGARRIRAQHRGLILGRDAAIENTVVRFTQSVLGVSLLTPMRPEIDLERTQAAC